jgi:hypothetical protein
MRDIKDHECGSKLYKEENPADHAGTYQFEGGYEG